MPKIAATVGCAVGALSLTVTGLLIGVRLAQSSTRAADEVVVLRQRMAMLCQMTQTDLDIQQRDPLRDANADLKYLAAVAPAIYACVGEFPASVPSPEEYTRLRQVLDAAIQRYR
ncbi:MAG: hypothetical protein H6709_10195 [Kofleriaceae bacterium]|nr:hypothetical protein [Kofleriaceae bacterium]MCB9572445.1 hypothetical protein [Kofleriaceae bacterium]